VQFLSSSIIVIFPRPTLENSAVHQRPSQSEGSRLNECDEDAFSLTNFEAVPLSREALPSVCVCVCVVMSVNKCNSNPLHRQYVGRKGCD